MIDLSWLGCCNNDQNSRNCTLVTKSTQTNTNLVDNQLSVKETDVYHDLVKRMNIQTTPRNRIYL